MRILAVIVNLVPYHLARWGAVVRAGHHVEVVQRTAHDDFHVLETDPAVAPFRVRTLSAAASDAVGLRRQLAEAILLSRADVVVVAGYAFAESLAAIEVARDFGLPMVLCSESNRHDAPRRPWIEWLKRRVVRQAGAALVGGSPQRSYLIDLGLSPQRIFAGYNAVDNAHFAAAQRWSQASADERRALGLPARYILAVSRFTPKKNLLSLIDAYALWRGELDASTPAPDLVILGDGPLLGALEARIAGHRIQDRVHLPGACSYDDLPSRYGMAEAFIHASRVEQWGLVVNEAMAAGLPVMVSRTCGCVAELVHPGDNGILFDPCSVESIAAAFRWWQAQTPASRHRLGEASRRIVAAFSPEAFAQGLEAAVRMADHLPVSPPGWLDRLTLRLLLWRACRTA